jgi:LytS/YehU family sensor histidine kinase
MRYEKQEFVPVRTEWDYLLDFIAVQKLRFEYTLPINMEISGSPEACLVPPYLLIPFVENAFKHGDLKDSASPLTILLDASPGTIHFSMANKISKRQQEEGGGLGIENAKRRLELLYPKKHELYYGQKDDLYLVRLKLNTGNKLL